MFPYPFLINKWVYSHFSVGLSELIQNSTSVLPKEHPGLLTLVYYLLKPLGYETQLGRCRKYMSNTTYGTKKITQRYLLDRA